jgi:colanic acid biosynthesis glycosyl transferase WcaI
MMASNHLRILILGLNYAPEMVGVAVYTSGMAEALTSMGHKVRVVAGQPYYPQWCVFSGFSRLRWTRSNERGVDVVRCPHYVPAKPTGPRRIIHHVSFSISALFPMLWSAMTYRPDIVIAVAPCIIAAPVARLSAMVSGAKGWLHVQDFELEAAMATGLVREGLAARLAKQFERLVLRSFDRVTSISTKMCERLVDKGVNPGKVAEVRNWAAVDDIQPLGRPSNYRERWNIETPHVALYSGNIANKQGVEVIVEVARVLRDRRDLTFVICGEGPNRARLEEGAHGLTNIRFFDLQPVDDLGELLGLATVHLLPQLASAADLVLPSKLGNMMASGVPIIATAAPGTGLAAEVEGCGLVVAPGDADALASAIEQLLDGGHLREISGRMGLARARSRFSKDAAMASLMDARPRMRQRL